MMKTHNHISDERLSKYFDGEITAGEQKAIEEHLRHCSYCNRHLHQLQQLHTIVEQSIEPELTRDLWSDIKHQIDLRNEDEYSSFTVKKWMVAAVISLIMLAGGWWLTGGLSHGVRLFKSVSVTDVNQFAFDYGLYLSGLENPEIMQQFNKGYNRQQAENGEMVDSAVLQARNNLINSLPRDISVVSIYLLESGCCQCNQYTLEYNGQQITLFQQPKKHPAEFTGYHKKHTKIDTADCSRVDAGDHTALAFDSGESKYVVVGRKNDPMLAAIMHRLTGSG